MDAEESCFDCEGREVSVYMHVGSASLYHEQVVLNVFVNLKRRKIVGSGHVTRM